MEWIRLEDRLPENDVIVLCCDIYNDFVSLGKFYESEDDEGEFELMFIDKVQIDSQPTHWMPLPSPPKDES